MISDEIYPELKTTGKLSVKNDNYLIWKAKILFVLADYGLDDVLTSPDNSTDPQWLDRDESARFVHILASLDDDLCTKYAYYPTAKSIMDSLESLFNSASVSRKMNEFRRYRNHKMLPHMPINKHIFRMRALAVALECAGVNVPDKMQAALLVNSVPEEWREDVAMVQLRSHGCEEDLTLHNATLRLRIASDARKWKNYVSNKSNKGFKVVCKMCGKKGHRKRHCPEALRLEEMFKSLYLDDSCLIGYPLLKTRLRLDSSGSNFYLWENKLPQLFYSSKLSKVSYVLNDPKPPEKDVDHPKKWLADDLLCRHLMLGAMDDDLFLSFHGYPSAKSLMDAIKEFFTFSSNARRQLLLEKYMDRQMCEGTSIIHHNVKMERLALKLEIAGVTIPDELQAFTLMDSLPESWDDSLIVLRRDMDLKKKEVDLKALRSKLLEVEQLRDLFASRNETEMPSKKLVKKSGKAVKVKCFTCGGQGHYASECPNKGKN